MWRVTDGNLAIPLFFLPSLRWSSSRFRCLKHLLGQSPNVAAASLGKLRIALTIPVDWLLPLHLEDVTVRPTHEKKLCTSYRTDLEWYGNRGPETD